MPFIVPLGLWAAFGASDLRLSVSLEAPAVHEVAVRLALPRLPAAAPALPEPCRGPGLGSRALASPGEGVRGLPASAAQR